MTDRAYIVAWRSKYPKKDDNKKVRKWKRRRVRAATAIDAILKVRATVTATDLRFTATWEKDV